MEESFTTIRRKRTCKPNESNYGLTMFEDVCQTWFDADGCAAVYVRPCEARAAKDETYKTKQQVSQVIEQPVPK